MEHFCQFSSIAQIHTPKAKCRHEESPQQALRVLTWMNDLRKSNRNDAQPNESSYNTILGAYSRSGSADAPEKIAKILSYMDRMSTEGMQIDLKPSTISYNSYLSALVNGAARGTISGDVSAQKAEKLLNKMIKRYENGDDVEPDGWTFTFVIQAWAKSGTKNAASKAEKVLRLMEAYHRRNVLVWSDKSNVTLYINQFNTKPISIAYNSVIDAYAKSNTSGSARCAEDILRRMESVQMSGENNDVKPDLVSYNSCIHAYAKSRERGVATKAERLLRHMEDVYKDGDTSVRPDVRTYNGVLDCWAKSGEKEAAYQAEKILNEIYENYDAGVSDVLPTTVTFNTVMYAHVRSGHPQSGQRAEDILNQMDELYRDGMEEVKPDVISFTNVINAWSKSRNEMAGQRALAILNRMEELHDAGYSKNIRPNSFTINAVINALSKSREIGKARMAFDTLQRAKQKKISGVNMNIKIYNSVLNACAYSDKRRGDDPNDILNIASKLMEEIQEQKMASDITYSTYLRVLSIFMSPGEKRLRMLEQTFRQCCDDGLLSQGVLDQLRWSVDSNLYKSLMKEGSSSGDRRGEIAVNWSRNVKYERQYK
uniref:Pentacotripeptide-repeat region of PRORP domain-containing protein n=1 Tax=Ditylum brightwellii TaxID=49249 RepID=A0A7S4VRB4_9STRA